jgi:hypothetical protein
LKGWDQEDCGSRPAWAKNYHIPSTTNSCTVVHICHPKLHRKLRAGGSWFQASLGKNVWETPYLNRKKLGLIACSCHPRHRKPKTGL